MAKDLKNELKRRLVPSIGVDAMNKVLSAALENAMAEEDDVTE